MANQVKWWFSERYGNNVFTQNKTALSVFPQHTSCVEEKFAKILVNKSYCS